MKCLIAVFMILVSLSASAAMTDAQLQTLAADIRASNDPEVVAALSIRNDAALTTLYRQPTAFVVWRTSIPSAEYREAITWTEVDGLTNGRARIWEWMTENGTRHLDASKPGIRQGLADAFAANTTTRANLLAVAKRQASRAEALFVSGAGTSGSPGLLGWEGPLQIGDVSDALNRY